nr:hypothetical protein Iba_chr13dCG4180 [Ipomoea batatas]
MDFFPCSLRRRTAEYGGDIGEADLSGVSDDKLDHCGFGVQPPLNPLLNLSNLRLPQLHSRDRQPSTGVTLSLVSSQQGIPVSREQLHSPFSDATFSPSSATQHSTVATCLPGNAAAVWVRWSSTGQGSRHCDGTLSSSLSRRNSSNDDDGLPPPTGDAASLPSPLRS